MSGQEARSAATSHFTDRCMAIIDGNFMAPRCGLKLGHDGPHEPIKVGKQTVSESPAATTAPEPGTLRCDNCGRVGTRAFHRVAMVYPKPDRWFCNDFRACRKRKEARRYGDA